MQPKVGTDLKFLYLQELERKTITEEKLLKKVEHDFSLLPEILHGTSSPKASVRYGCGRMLMALSEKHPEQLYPYMDNFIALLDSEHRILTWNAMAIIANLTKVDKDRKFDKIFEKYYSFLNDEYMVTVANVVGNSARIALAKPYIAPEIAKQLLRVEKISPTPHLTEECKRVIAGHAVKSFDAFFEEIEAKDEVLAFVRRQLDSPRASLGKQAREFLEKQR